MTWGSESQKDPNVIKVDSTNRIMFYSGRPGYGPTDRFQIGKATSSDAGSTWTNNGGNPVIALGGSGDSDEHGCSFPTVFFEEDGTLVCFYLGLNGSDVASICAATSINSGDSWTKHGSVITPGSSPALVGVIPGVLLYSNGLWHLYYSGTDKTVSDGCEAWTVLYATANDFLGPWAKHGPILSPSGRTTLSASLSAGDFVVSVDDSSVFTEGRQVGVASASSSPSDLPLWGRVKTIDSPTQITLTAPFWAAQSSGTNIVSIDGGSLIPRGFCRLASGGFRMYVTAFQQFSFSGPTHKPFCERVIVCESSSLAGPWVINDSIGIPAPRHPSNAATSTENFNVPILSV